MIWLAIVFISAAALAPALLALRGNGRNRDRGEAALTLHRAQLAELERDRTENRINAEDYAAALLEVQRRALNAADMRDAAPPPGARRPLIAVLAIIPIAALMLYVLNGHPGMPSAPSAAELRQRQMQETRLINQLRQSLATVDPHSPRAREGNALLGSVEEAQGDYAAAAAAWKAALASGFDPLFAAHAAEAASRAEGHVSPESAALFRQALAAAPANAPWRALAEQRLSEQP